VQASIVIPVWNGATVIADCLDSVYAHAGDELLEVICVDNASDDESAALIADRYPQVRLLCQPVNLGFAGGVNAGMEAAQGNVFVLLNQDCMVHDGWLKTLVQALQDRPQVGIAGCTLLNADGTLNHTGATISRPFAYGQHLTEADENQTLSMDFVTGAAVAIRREVWNRVGRFDEGFYPAYYEDADFCYRARRQGFETVHVPQAKVTHLFSSQELGADPVKYIAMQHRSRYRFVTKHFDDHEIGNFFEAEYAFVEEEENIHHALGRVLAARHTLRTLGNILDRRRTDLGNKVSATHRRRLQVGFTHIQGQYFARAEKLSQLGLIEPPTEEWQHVNQDLQELLSVPLTLDLLTTREEQSASGQLLILQQREHDLLERIHFRSPNDTQPETKWRRLFRLLVLRPLNFLSGREHLLLAELNAVHTARMDLIEQSYRTSLEQVNVKIEQVNGLYRQRVDQTISLFHYHREQLERRTKLLETLIEYDQH